MRVHPSLLRRPLGPGGEAVVVGPPRRVRAAAGEARRRVGQTLQVLDPVRLALRQPPADLRVAVLCVYRARNAAVVHDVLARLPADATVRLWSLDGVVPEGLAGATVGTGPGNRFVLLNRLLVGVAPSARCDGLLLVDDDVRFVVGDLPRLVDAARRCSLDVYQPGHAAESFANWRFVRRRPLTFARRTDFVEQGPLVGLSARAQELLLPLPEELGMAWGVEVRWWAAAKRHGLRQGIVDAVAVQHLTPTAVDYDRTENEEVLEREVRSHGLQDIRDIQRALERWRLLRWPRGGTG